MTDSVRAKCAREDNGYGHPVWSFIYAPTEDAAEDDELSSTVKGLVGDLEENESTLRVWTTLDS